MAKDKDDKSAAKDGDAAQENKAAAEDDGLVEVTKGRESLRVHPSCVKAHVDAGWSE